MSAAPRRSAVLNSLRDVLDPCSIAMAAPVDVVEMGLVERVEIEGGSVLVRLVLTDTSCVFYRDLRKHVIDAVTTVPGVEGVQVELDATVMWTPDRMHRSGRGHS